jgi:hypothetical protein
MKYPPNGSRRAPPMMQKMRAKMLDPFPSFDALKIAADKSLPKDSKAKQHNAETSKVKQIITIARPDGVPKIDLGDKANLMF